MIQNIIITNEKEAMKKHKLVNSEALDWIQSLSLNGEQDSTFDGYLGGTGMHHSPRKGLTMEAYIRHLLRCGLSKWIRKHKLKLRRNLEVLDLEVNVALRLQEWKSRTCLTKWADYVSNQQLKLYIASRTELKLSMGMFYRYKMRTCLHYWVLRVRDRRRKKLRLFRAWKDIANGRALVNMLLRAQIGALLCEAFTRWKRRSKWPLVASKRAMWMEKQAISTLTLHAHRVNRRRAQIRKGDISRMKSNFPRLVTRLIVQKRSQTVLQMGSDLYSLKHLTCAVKKWHTLTMLQNKIAHCLDQALSSKRQKGIHECIIVLKRHAQRAVRREILLRTAYLHHKMKVFQQFKRGVRLTHQGQDTQIDTLDSTAQREEKVNTYSVLAASAQFIMQNNSTAGSTVSNRVPRYVLFRERLYHKQTSLVQQWRSCTVKQSIQREAKQWGLRWYKRKVFRTLQLNCRKRRNVTLNNCFASLQCKHRLLRLYTLQWHQRATLAKSLHLMSSYIYMRKYVRKWAKWCRVSRNLHWKQRRAVLRWTVNHQQKALQWWVHSTYHQQHCRYGLKVFRKLHPVPTTSAVGRVFQAWRWEYLPQRKHEKKVYKQVVLLRKYASRKRLWQHWSDAFETSAVRRHSLLRVCRVLYRLYSLRRSMIYRLSNALLLRVHNTSPATPRECKLVTFLARHGLMVRTKHQLMRFYMLCFLRKYVHAWRGFAKHRQQQLVFFHHTYRRAAAQCSQYFATYYHVLYKHNRWVQWRAVRAWYVLHQRRMVHFSGINTRIHLKQLFQRWVEAYNRKLINYHLRIPATQTLHNTTSKCVSDTHNTTIHSNRTSMSSQFNDTFITTTQRNTTSHTNITTNTLNTQGKKAIATVNDSIHLDPTQAHQLANQRLHQLRSTKPSNSINISNISAISTASSIGSTVYQPNNPLRGSHSAGKASNNNTWVNASNTTRQPNTPVATTTARAYAPKYTSKVIDTTQHTSLNSSTLSTTSHRSTTAPTNTSYSRMYKENKPNKDNQSLFSENLNVSYSRLHENRIDPAQSPGSGFVFAPVADTSSARVSGKKAYGETLLRKSVDPSTSSNNNAAKKPLWGNLIGEDGVDAAKRSYTGQYLLGKAL